MGLFRLERKHGDQWVTLAAASVPVDPSMFGEPEGSFPPKDGPVLAGLPGMQARVTYDEQELELYSWEKIPRNPLDPESDTIWGWKLINRNPYPPDHVLSQLPFA